MCSLRAKFVQVLKDLPVSSNPAVQDLGVRFVNGMHQGVIAALHGYSTV